MELDYAGKSALITGGSKGIGLATARAFAAEGAALHLASRTADDLERVRDDIIRDFDVPVAVHAVDLSIGDAARTLARECSHVDILVNNAGAIPGGTLDDIDETVWRQAWDLKLFGYINLMRAMYAEMKALGRGVIVNNCGTAGNQKPSDYAAGVTANGALITLTRALGGTSLNHGIRVLGINPGDIENERGVMFLRRQAEKAFGDADRWREMYSDLPGGSAPDSDDMANAILFLASPRARYISGIVLTIDGGLSASQSVIGG
jgi:NAD(P)-dependent dehydrogenase (short-subunit alcohol dehydrogenase family)